MSGERNGASLLVQNLEAQGVEYVFGIPGAKIDPVFDALVDSKIKTVVCRHEQNAAFIAGGLGRITGKAGVVLVTSGPGCSNLVTGPCHRQHRGRSHRRHGRRGAGGRAAEADAPEHGHGRDVPAGHQVRGRDQFAGSDLGGAWRRSFRAAESGRPGPAFLSLPKDVMKAEATGDRAHAGALPGARPGRRRLRSPKRRA